MPSSHSPSEPTNTLALTETPLCPLHEFDKAYNAPVCGIDEVGRGPLAGPVTAACVFIPAKALIDAPLLLTMNDSKKISAPKRDALALLIKEHCIWGLGEACVFEIDEVNILQATLRAMERAAQDMLNKALVTQHGETKAIQPFRSNITALVDGNKLPPALPFENAETIIKGDSKSLCIAAASILAKTTRDHYMQQLAIKYPAYGWHSNAGYGAKTHIEAIEKHGATPHHRMSFAPLKYM